MIVGLAAASIFLWIFFFTRRRRRRRRIDHETAVSASLAAAGYNRTLIDDEDTGPGIGMRQRFGSSSTPTINTPITESERAAEGVANLYDPYVEYGRPVGGAAGYHPARSDSPGQHGSYSSGMSRPPGAGHAPRHSDGSSDLLLGGMAVAPAPMETPVSSLPPTYTQTTTTPTLPTRSPMRLAAAQSPQPQDNAATSSTRDSGDRSSSSDDRLDPFLQAENTRRQELRDDVDYSRPVLDVCPFDRSHHILT